MDEQRYALRDYDDRVDGRGLNWWVFLKGIGSRTASVGGVPLEPAAVSGWYHAPHDFDPDSSVVEVERPSRWKTVGYHLAISGASLDGYERDLDTEEYEELCEDDARASALYEPTREEEPAEIEEVRGPWLVIDGSPPPQTERQWRASLPWELRYQPEYLHLFPGHLDGFRAAAKEALEAVDGVSAYISSGGPISVYVKLALPRLDPLEKWEAGPNLRGSSARARRRLLERHNSGIQQVTRSLEIPCADNIYGATLVEGLVAWDESLAEIVAYVRAIVAQRCPTCEGRGFVESHNHPEEA